MISILTPTFNRQHTLSRLFNSLILQTDKDFEWIIIDDGSIDATAVLVEDFRKKCDFDLIYCYQENNGKPMALNAGVKACRGDYIFIVDSGDALTPDAIKLIKESIHDCLSEKESFSGVGFRKAYIKGGIIGNDLNNSSEHIYYLNATEISNLINGDVAYCFKKESLVKNPFPRIEDEKFVPELYIWNKITDKAKIRFNISKVIYLCEYLDDGLSKNFHNQLKKYPKGFKIYYKDQRKREKTYIKKTKMLIRYLQCCYYEKIK